MPCHFYTLLRLLAALFSPNCAERVKNLYRQDAEWVELTSEFRLRQQLAVRWKICRTCKKAVCGSTSNYSDAPVKTILDPMVHKHYSQAMLATLFSLGEFMG